MSISESIIIHILKLCHRYNIEMFLVNKTFERILIKIIYAPDLSDKLHRIACYENDESMIEMLTENKLIGFKEDIEFERRIELLDYWKENNCEETTRLLNWKRSNDEELYEFMNKFTHTYYEEDKVCDLDSEFGFELLKHFKLLKDRFIEKDPYYWKYKHYEIKYTKEHVYFLDYKFDNFLIISCSYCFSRVMCNKFEYIEFTTPRITIKIKEINLDNLFKSIKHFYRSCIYNNFSL